MRNDGLLYHGSKLNGLKTLQPNISDFERTLVYATPAKAFAAIFINTPGGTFEALWGRLRGVPFYCERKKDVFEKNYSGFSGSIYHVKKSVFRKIDRLWQDEYVSERQVFIKREKEITDTKSYLLKMQERKNFIFIPYSKRLDYFPHLDEQLITNCLMLHERFGDQAFDQILKYQSEDVLEKVKRRLLVNTAGVVTTENQYL